MTVNEPFNVQFHDMLDDDVTLDDKLARRQSYRAGSTVSFNPTALVTATRVESRGFPFADKAR